MSDLIKREDAIATIGVMYERCDTYDITDYRDLMLEAVKVLPSADGPQGEWLPFEFGDERWHKCSCCGTADRFIEYVPRPNGTVGKLVAIRNFCPNCGARMKGADDE